MEPLNLRVHLLHVEDHTLIAGIYVKPSWHAFLDNSSFWEDR